MKAITPQEIEDAITNAQAAALAEQAEVATMILLSALRRAQETLREHNSPENNNIALP